LILPSFKANSNPPVNGTTLENFVFSNELGGEGTFKYTIRTNNPNLQIMLYLGITNNTKVSGSWDLAYDQRDTATCEELVDLHRGGQAGIKPVVSDEEGAFLTSQSARAYFWFVAVADCTAPNGVDLPSYTLTFTNPGNIWHAQFSYDEQGIAETYIFFTIFYTLVLGVHLWGVWKLIRMESWHPIVRILTVAITFQFLASLTEMIHYLIYMNNGIGAPGLKGLGELLTMGAQLILMFLCVLVAKGWAITTSLLSDRNILLVTMALFLLAYLALFIWDNAGRDPASTLYFYDSIPGLIVILLRIAVTAWFLWCLRSTIGFEALPDKRKFYVIFGFCFTVWFLLLPGIVAFSLVLDPWYRFRTVRGLTLSADALAYLAFIVLLWPSRAASFFNIKPTPLLLSENDQGSAYGTDQGL